MKPINFLHPAVFVGKAEKKGRGMFSSQDIGKDEIIEVAPVIVMTPKERKLIDGTILHDYIFEWGDSRTYCCMALGYVPLYNHAYDSNCEYVMDYRKKIIWIKTVKPIRKGEELFINYNGDTDSNNPVWFDAH